MEEEETKPTLESRVIVALGVIFIVVLATLVTKTIYDKQHEREAKEKKEIVACITNSYLG